MTSLRPRSVYAAIRNHGRKPLLRFARWIKQPRMVLGYQDSSGELRTRTRMSDTVVLYHPERISIGDNAFVGHYTILDGTGGLEIGEGSQIAALAGIFTHSSHIAIRLYGKHYLEVHEDAKKGYPVAPVKIGRYVFVGAGAKILPGVTIGDGSLIAAGSVVSKSVPPLTIVTGNPAKARGSTMKLDRRYLDDEVISAWYHEWQTVETEPATQRRDS